MFTTFNMAVAVVILLVMFIWVAANKRAESRLKRSLEKMADVALFQPQFKCVVISPCRNSCRRVIEYSTKPILLKNAPLLPLIGCDAAACECSFIQHEDRRTGKDRRHNEAPSKRLAYTNKRTQKDRRRDSIQEFLLPKYRMYN